MVTTEINDHKSEMNSEIKVLSVVITDQIKDVVHNPKWHQKLISKRVQQHWKLNKMLNTHVEEDRYKQQAAKAEQERQQRRKRVEAPEVKAPVQEPAVENHTKPAVAAAPAQVDTRRKKQARPDKKRDDFDREEDGPRKQQRNRNSKIKWEIREIVTGITIRKIKRKEQP